MKQEEIELRVKEHAENIDALNKKTNDVDRRLSAVEITTNNIQDDVREIKASFSRLDVSIHDISKQLAIKNYMKNAWSKNTALILSFFAMIFAFLGSNFMTHGMVSFLQSIGWMKL